MTTPNASTTDGPALLEDAEDRYRGCGWFESSAELAQGLLVVESREPELVLEIYFPGVARGSAAPGSRSRVVGRRESNHLCG